MNLLLIDETAVNDERLVTIKDERALHMREILKVEAGRKLRIGVQGGNIGEAEVVQVGADSVTLRIEHLDYSPQISEIRLVVAMPRPQTLKKVLEIATAMGVSSLDLISAEKVEKSYFFSPLLRSENLTTHIRRGLEQAQQTVPPAISIHNRFHTFYNEHLPSLLDDSDYHFLVHPYVERSLSSALLDRYSRSKRVVLLIGPEGGWSEREIELFEQKGFTSVHLGTRILRVEHAICAALSHLECLAQVFEESGGRSGDNV